MKKIFFLFAFIFISVGLFAQSPQVFKYQTVVRDAGGGVYANKIVSFRISIVRDNPTGTSVYVETHNTTTNDFGIVNLSIGSGSPVSGSFGAIDWGTHEHFIKTEIDMLGGTDFQFMGTSQLLSVPYALFAGKSANAADDFDKDSTNEIQTISEIGNNVTLSNNGGSFIDSDNQSLSKVGDSIKLVNGGSVKDNDNQSLSLIGSQLHISNGNSVTIAGTIDLDWDPTNELQTLSLSGDTISISSSNHIVLPPDADHDTTNELQTITEVGNTITLSHGGGSVTDTDTDNQSLSSSKNGEQVTVSITDGNNTVFDVRDNDADTTNELQVLSYANDTLSLSNGNYVVIPLSQIVPTGTCINSPNINPPSGYSYSGNSIESTDFWSLENNPSYLRSSIKIVELNGKIYAIGGYKDLGYGNYENCNNVDEYDPTTKTWSTKMYMPTARNRMHLVVNNNKIYAIGGYIMQNGGGSIVSRKVEEFDPTANTWTTKMDYSSNISLLGMSAVCNNKIYFIGGTETSGVTSQKVLEFDPANNTWTSKTNMPTQRNDFRLEVYNNQIYVFGGTYSGSYLQGLELYNPATDIWTNKLGMNNTRSDFTSCLFNDKIFVFGGYIGYPINKCEYYDITLNTWHIITSLPTIFNETYPTYSFAANNKLYFFGADDNTNIISSYTYDLTTENWIKKADYPFLNKNLEMVICNNSIFSSATQYSTVNPYEFGIYNQGTTYYMHCKN